MVKLPRVKYVLSDETGRKNDKFRGYEFSVFDPGSQLCERPENFRPERESNPVICDAGVLLHQLGYQANCELVVIQWVHHKVVDDR